MSDEYDDDDELPPISVNTSARGSDILAMPSAEALASQRAREAECEQELLTLRAQHEGGVCTDSSGSEGETALAAAVGALLVKPPARLEVLDLLPEVLQSLSVVMQAPALLQADADMLNVLTDDVCGAVAAGCARTEEELLCAAAWLCVRGAAGGAGGVGAAGGSRRARRTLHQLLDSDAFGNISQKALKALGSALGGGARARGVRLELADALGAAQGEGAARLRLALLAAELAHTLGCPPPDQTDLTCACEWAGNTAASRWRTLGAGVGVEAGAGAGAVRAAGRLLRTCGAQGRAACAAPRARLLAAATPAGAGARHTPERLEVLVGASKLQLLFRD